MTRSEFSNIILVIAFIAIVRAAHLYFHHLISREIEDISINVFCTPLTLSLPRIDYKIGVDIIFSCLELFFEILEKYVQYKYNMNMDGCKKFRIYLWRNMSHCSLRFIFHWKPEMCKLSLILPICFAMMIKAIELRSKFIPAIISYQNKFTKILY